MKYLIAGLRVSLGGELFDLPHQSANDISRHDVVKDITRVEATVADGYADFGCVLVLSNDRSYWQPPARAVSIDPAFRLHEGRVLAGTLQWADRAGTGTTKGRDTPLELAGRHACHWRDYSRVGLPDTRAADLPLPAHHRLGGLVRHMPLSQESRRREFTDRHEQRGFEPFVGRSADLCIVDQHL
jgi:hypothetical protein